MQIDAKSQDLAVATALDEVSVRGERVWRWYARARAMGAALATLPISPGREHHACHSFTLSLED